MGGKSKAQTIGYKYYLGMHHALCHGPVDNVSQITVDNRVVWGGSSTGGTINVNAPTIFGGEKREGGISGPVDILMGGSAQGQNDYLVSMLGADIPAYRGVLSAVLKQCYLGNNPYLKAWRYRAQRIHKRQDGAEQWYDAKAEISAEPDLFKGPWEYQVLPFHANPGTTELDIPLTGWDDSANMPFGNDVWSYPDPTLSVIWARKTISNIPSGIKIQARADNGCVLFVNGVYVGGSNVDNADISNNDDFPVTYTIPSAGTYEIVVKAFTENGSGAQAGNYLKVSPAGIPDMNPIHIIRECLTDPDWGMGYTDDDVDADIFEAAADQLYSEGLGMSILWDKQITIEAFVGEILKHIDAALYVSRTTGKFVIKLIRADYDPDELLVLDESNINSISDPSRTAFGELVNSVTVNYWDTSTGKNASLTVTDTAMVQMQGAPINTTVQYPGFTNSRNASLAGQRDLRTLSTPTLSCQIIANSEAKGLNVGDVFKLNWSKWQVSGMVMRVTEISYGTGRNNQVRITCTQDIFGTPPALVIAPAPPGWSNPSQPPTAIPTNRQIAFEAPYLELVQASGQGEVDSTLAGDPETGYVMAAAARPTNAINASLWLDSGAGYESGGSLDFCPSAILSAAVDKLEDEFSVVGMDNIEEVEIGSFAQIGTELVRIDAINTGTGVITVGRGVLDTVPVEHSIGEALLFWDLFSGYSPTTYVLGEEVDVKITPVTGMGELAIEDAPALAVVMGQRAFAPYPPGDLKINGERYEPDATYEGEVTVTWTHRDRKQQTSGTLADALDGDIGPEAGQVYRLQAYIAGILVHTEDDIAGTSTTWNPSAAGTAKVEVHSKRDDVYSWQAPFHEFEVGTNLLLNPSGFDGTTNWTQTLGTTFAATGPTIAGIAQSFVMATSSSKSHVSQTFDIPSENAADAAAGQLNVVFSFNYYTYTDSDNAYPRIFFWSGTGGTGTLLGIAYSTPLTSDTEVRVDFTHKVPKGTQSISVGLVGYRATGSELSFYFNGCVSNLIAGTHTVVPVYVRDQIDNTGWTVTTGSRTSDTSAEQGDYSLPSHYGGSQAALAYYKDIAASADALALIAGGTATLRMRSMSWSTNGADRSRIYVECRDSGGTVLATCQDAAVNTSWGTGIDFNNNTVTIPAGTVTFRIGQSFARFDGTVNDAHTAQISVVVEKPI